MVDIKRLDNPINIFKWNYKSIKNVYGILAAVPCTDYAVSGAKHFKQKDKDGITAKSQQLVAKTKEIIDWFKPEGFWCIENPISRIHTLNPWMGNPKFRFHPWEFAGYIQPKVIRYTNQYNKRTCLWGKFKHPIKKPLPPAAKYYEGYTNLGGKSERTKELRSATPMGFSIAFYEVNKAI